MTRRLRDGFLRRGNTLVTRTLLEGCALLPAEGGPVPVLRVSVAARRLQHFSAAELFKHPVICTRDAGSAAFSAGGDGVSDGVRLYSPCSAAPRPLNSTHTGP